MTKFRNVILTAHAINQASLRLQHHWKTDRRKAEGLYDWLLRVALEATHKNKAADPKVTHKRMHFVFAYRKDWAFLKTVMPDDTKSPRVVLISDRRHNED